MDISDIAHERASRYAPLPKHDPVYAGLIGAVVTGLVVALFMGVARLHPDSFATATVATVVIGFLAPYAYLKNQERLHSKAWAREYEALRQDQHAKKP